MTGEDGLPRHRIVKEGIKSARKNKLFTILIVAMFFILGGIAAITAQELEEVLEGEEEEEDEREGDGTPATDVEYEPVIKPSEFVSDIDNPYFPLEPGSRYVYEGTSEEGAERIVVQVTNDTKVILGVTCVVVRDTVTVDGQVVEDTWDWYAQDSHGNVWYFGEDTKEYDGGQVVSTAGSWTAGTDGAKAGIIMLMEPLVGLSYRQEYYAGEAEDMAEVHALDATATVPAGSYTGVLRTREWTPMEPKYAEDKYYVQGVGCVLEVMTKGGSERVELIEYTTGAS